MFRQPGPNGLAEILTTLVPKVQGSMDTDVKSVSSFFVCKTRGRPWHYLICLSGCSAEANEVTDARKHLAT